MKARKSQITRPVYDVVIAAVMVGSEVPQSSTGELTVAPMTPAIGAEIVVGGDTLFANMHLAYERLSPEMQSLCERLSAVHDIARVFAKRLHKRPEDLHDEYPPMTQPVIRTHPETGKRVIYVNNVFTTHIEGLSYSESRWLLDNLEATAKDPEI